MPTYWVLPRSRTKHEVKDCPALRQPRVCRSRRGVPRVADRDEMANLPTCKRCVGVK